MGRRRRRRSHAWRFRIWRPKRRPWWQRKNVKNFKKFPAKSRPRLTITILDFTKWIKTKQKIILKQLYLKIINVNTLSYVIYYTIDFTNTVLCTYNYDF